MLAVPTQPGQFPTEPQASDPQFKVDHHCGSGPSADARNSASTSTPTPTTTAASFTITVQLPAATSQPFAAAAASSSLQFAACLAQVAFATVQQQQQQQQFGRFIAHLLSRTGQPAPTAAATVWWPLNTQ